MFDKANCKFYNINSSKPYYSSLVNGILLRHSKNQLKNLIILLPSNRACRILLNCLTYIFHIPKNFLPKILSISDLGEQEKKSSFSLASIIEGDQKKALSLIERRFILYDIIKNKLHFENQSNINSILENFISLIKDTSEADIDLDFLTSITVDSEFSNHWDITNNLLKQIVKTYQLKLNELNKIDPFYYRNLQLKYLINTVKKNQHNVILAGVIGKNKISAKLIESISKLQNGSVIFQSDTTNIDSDYFNNIDITHPLYFYKKNLLKQHSNIKKITEWDQELYESKNSIFISEVFRPTNLTQHWHKYLHPNIFIENFEIFEAENILEEVSFISKKIKILNNKNEKIAIITNDHQFNTLLQSSLKSKNINFDSTQGTSLLALNESKLFYQLISLHTQEDFTANILAILKNKLIYQTKNRDQYLLELYQFEIEFCRKLNPKLNIKNIILFINKQCDEYPLLSFILDKIDNYYDKLFATKDIKYYTEYTYNIVYELANIDSEENQYEFHESFHEIISQITSSTNLLNFLDLQVFNDIVYYLFKTNKYNNSSLNPNENIKIFSLIESRLLESFDYVIITNCNEGIFPSEEITDNFLNNHMRTKLGLVSREENISHEANDFYQLLYQKKILLTRSKITDNNVTSKSRWLERIITIRNIITQKNDAYITTETEIKNPSIPKSFFLTPTNINKPMKLSVTQIEMLIQDPFGFYAKNIMDLYPMNKLNQDYDGRIFGILVHKVFDLLNKFFIKAKHINDEIFERIISKCLYEYKDSYLYSFWHSRLINLKQYALELFSPLNIKFSYSEVYGEYSFDTKYGNFILSARADLIIVDHKNKIKIFDFKTSQLPTKISIENFQSVQLALEGLIAYNNGFKMIPKNLDIEELSYIKLKGNNIKPEKLDALAINKNNNKEFFNFIDNSLKKLINDYCDPKFNFDYNILFNKNFDIYQHFARREKD